MLLHSCRTRAAFPCVQILSFNKSIPWVAEIEILGLGYIIISKRRRKKRRR